ncbi:hypothetical protein U9M48_015808 [Paspalum notatum var. saurae]|uniref:NAD-dependent epimerase/dehydratase domain-containing protein n=1 Tax=Paspalum notatum var. saurae TaxID=547442 RepID=A0AAQ3T7L1_PASNO
MTTTGGGGGGEEEEKARSTVVCVTGGGGYIGSWLVRKLLGRGCVVHATLRSLGTPSSSSEHMHGRQIQQLSLTNAYMAPLWTHVRIADEKKTGMLRALPGAEERLRLFEADVYDADTFEPAIAGCEFVFLVATPMVHDPNSTKYKDTTEAAVDAARIVLRQCERSGTVKRVIHTASVAAASPLKEDGTGYKDCFDESNWTPLNLSYAFTNAYLDVRTAYVWSKTLSEKELLSYNDDEPTATGPEEPRRGRAVEVVSLVCGLVGGDTIQSYLWSSIPVIVSPLTGDALCHNSLLFLQALLGCVPLAHLEDVCHAHVFCMDQPSMAGRFLCAAGYPTMRDYLDHFAAKHPDLKIQLTEVAGEGVRIRADSRKLEDLGFRFKYGVEETLDYSVECAKRLGEL